MSHSERITYLIYCTEQPTPNLDYRIQVLVGHLWYARMHKASIIVPDNYTSLLIAREADRHGIPIKVFGVNKHPRCGVRPYCRVERDTCDLRMIEESDAAFLVGKKAKPLAREAQRLGKETYCYEWC